MNALTLEDAAARITSDLSTSPPVAEACNRVLEWLFNQPRSARAHVSLQRLGIAAAVTDVSELAPVIRYLTGARVPLFDIAYEFVDGETIERISADEIRDAKVTGEFCHPLTGEIVSDFESKVIVYFAVSEAAANFGEVRR